MGAIYSLDVQTRDKVVVFQYDGKELHGTVILTERTTSGAKVRVRAGDFILNVDEKQVAKGRLATGIEVKCAGVQGLMKTVNIFWPRFRLELASLLLISLTIYPSTGIGLASGAGLQIAYQPILRYAIIYNDPTQGPTSRKIKILMQPSELSEANLRILFELLSRRLKDVPSYDAYIETSLEDIDTPEEHEESIGTSEGPSNPKAFQHPSASIRHTPEADTLWIFLPSRAAQPQKINLRTQ